MDLNSTPKGNRIHIAVFGKRNAGKSSIINALTNQDISIVSNIKGTTTDPVYKAMELLPLGPVVIIDTPGLDDSGELGELRVNKTLQVLNKTDIAILIIDSNLGFDRFEEDILNTIKSKNIPFVIALNKIDIIKNSATLIKNLSASTQTKVIAVSSVNGYGIETLKEVLSNMLPYDDEPKLVGDLLEPSDIVVLVVPIDESAPKGRLILPQQQTIRDILDNNAIAIVTKETELKHTLCSLGKKPKLVITDSQVFDKVSKDTPDDIPLTSFSILFARYKGDLEELVRGVKAIDKLKDGDKILIAEGCTHHRQCNDIGTVKIPNWLRKHTGKDFIFETSSGTGYATNIKDYAMIIHCGGCMLNHREMLHRINMAKENNIPIVNYGIFIAYITNILERSISFMTKDNH